MAAPHRLDRYGRPLPELAPASTAPRFDDQTNVGYRTYLYALITDACHIVCRRGWSGEVRVSFSVQDGRIQSDMRVGVERVRKAPSAEREHGSPG